MTQTTPYSPSLPGPVDLRRQPLDVVQRALRVRRLPARRPAAEPGRLVIVSNRVVHHAEPQTGRLAGILRNVLRQHGGLWFGWSGKVTDVATTAVREHRTDGFHSASVDLGSADHAALFDGFPAHVLHPLLQSRLNDMAFDRGELEHWRCVNARMAAALQQQLQPGDRIWITGLHLLPLVSELRALGVRNRIGLFVHDALPAAGVLASMPYHERVFSAFAECDLIGVQTAADRRALTDYLTSAHGARRGRDDVLHMGTRNVRLSAFAVGIDVDHMVDLAQQADGHASLRKFRRNLGTQKLLVGVDRPDPASGLCQRLRAVDYLLEQWPRLAGTFLMLQISPPVRYDMPCSRAFDRKLSHHVSDLNGRHAGPDWAPVRYVKKEMRASLLAGYLRAARVGLVTPLHDGMALGAKEYVACQDPSDPGVLVLSRFAGAASELTDAVQVNPRDVADVAAGIRTAMRMPLDERKARWESLMGSLRRHDVRSWSDDFLHALGRTGVAQVDRLAATARMAR